MKGLCSCSFFHQGLCCSVVICFIYYIIIAHFQGLHRVGFYLNSFLSICGFAGSGTESDSDDSVPELEEQDSAQTQTQQAQVRPQSDQ